MLALNSKTALAALISTILSGFVSIQAQIPPSQRYQPISQSANSQQPAPHLPAGTSFANQRLGNSVPPSVHVPPPNARQLSAPQSPGQSQVNGDRPSQYTFSDVAENQNQTSSGRESASVPDVRGTVMQTGFTDEPKSSREPVVPEILANSNKPSGSAPVFQQPGRPANQLANPSAAQIDRQPSPIYSDPALPSAQPKISPDQFANQMQQLRGSAPRIAPQEFQNSNVQQEFEALQRQVAQRQQAKNGPAVAAPQSLATSSNKRDANTRSPSASTGPAPLVNPLPSAGLNPTRTASANGPAAAPLNNQRPQTMSGPTGESASDFISKLGPTRLNNGTAGIYDVPAAGTQPVPTDGSPATMHVPVDAMQDRNVQPVSGQTDSVPNASIKLTAPSIAVETFGPQTVGINKPVIYKVVVTNVSNSSAERVLIGIDLPVWVDIENVNLTGGEKEITDGKQQARVVWKVDQIPGNGSQTIELTAVPRKADAFDLGVEWTLAPRAGSANIKVTQPKLEMSIVGPDEVQFGEQALYHVTIRNPGTGTAENVVVMLPEALGGERASLGNILPGKDKNFQVELLARTAGELDLSASAIADGNLEVLAARKLTVRRAQLGISITGPSLKYAGSEGQYLVTISNQGDATANEIIAAMALPTGVQYLGGIESFALMGGGLKWPVGSLDPGQKREYTLNCQLDASGDLQLEVGTQGKGDLQAASACVTRVETVADLVLTVRDPKGPLPTGQSTVYEISVRNRGSRSAKNVNVVMQFSEGIEPKSASGLEHKLVPGQVLFAPIALIDSNQEITFKVNAEALKPGTHVFRAQLICDEEDSREIAEGTTKFFGNEVLSVQQNTANQKSEIGESQDFSSGVRR